MKRKFLLLVMMCLFGGFSSSLLAQDETVVTIGSTTGTRTNANFPIAGHKNYSLSQTFYKSASIGMAEGGTIRKISYMVSNTTAYTCSSNLKIYMRNTDTNNFPSSGNWYTMTEAEEVFEGTVDFTQKGSWTTITLDNPFKYEGGKNILVCVQAETESPAEGSIMFITQSQTGGTLYVNNPDNYYNITSSAPGGKSRVGYIPITQFTFGLAADATVPDPEFSTIYNQYAPLDEAEEVLNPYFQFVSTNTTNYKILLSKSEDFSNVQYIKGSADNWVTKESNVTTVTTEQFSNLEAGTTYYWKVLAKNISSGIESKEVYSKTFTFTTKAIEAKPDELESCSPTNETVCYDGYPTLSWTYGDNTTQYQLLLGTREDLRDETYTNTDVKVNWTTASALGDSYQTSGLAVGTYYWQVNVKNTAGTTKGDVYSFEIPGVENISNAEASDTELTWTFGKGTTEYRVLLSKPTTDDNPLEVVCTYLTKPEHTSGWLSAPKDRKGSYTLPQNLDAGVEYYWTVEVKSFADDKIYDNHVYEYDDENKPYKVFVPEVEIYSFVSSALAAAQNSSPSNKTTKLNNPTLEWAFNGDATAYKVFLGTDVNDLKEVTGWLTRETAEVGGIVSLKSTGSYQTEGLTAATKYYWRIDVRNDMGKEVKGTDIWWFGTTLPITTVEAVPSEIFPSLGVYGGTNINWDLVGAQSYNVYLDNLGDDKDAEIIKTTNSTVYTHAILATDMKLQYNMEEGYNIYVEADFGELGKSMSEAVNVKVSGKSKFSGIVYSSDYYTRLADATVTLTLKTDEFGNEIADATEYTYTYNTNSNGEMFETQNQNGVITQVKEFQFHNGIYEVTVKADYHETYTGELKIEHNGENNKLSVILTPDQTAIFNVTLYNVTFNSVDVYLENNNWEDAQPGYYHVYLKNGDKTEDLGQQYFGIHNEYATSVKLTYSDWATLGKGNYQFGVAKFEDKVNWSAAENIDYDVFEVEGDWNTAANWRDGVPSATAKVYILAPATIAASETVTTGTVNIEQGGSLTINGSLTAGNVYNNTQAGALCINDGGQLRQSNQNLNGKFVMTVTPPTSWDESNIDGWQFIASPVEGVEFSKFVPAEDNDVEGDYDLYQYDGENNKWRNHKHVYGEGEEAFVFGDKFVVGTAYLAALQYEKDVTFSGVLNAAQTYTFNVSHNAEKNAANYHLLGNPFTFAMDVKNFKATGLATGYAVLNAEGNDYLYLIKGQIPVGNGFFVMATEATAALTYSEARGAAEETANINIVAKGATGSNNVIINMANDKEGFRKLEGFNKEIANIYVENKGNKYAIYNCESDVNEVELTFVAKQMGSYSLSFDINGEFETVTLVDRMTGVETDMIAEGEYNFIATSNDMKNRFVVRLSNSMTATEEFLANFVYQSGEELIINAEGAIQIIDMMGRVVYSNENANGNDRINVSEFNNAAYVVRVINSNGVKSQKVVIY